MLGINHRICPNYLSTVTYLSFRECWEFSRNLSSQMAAILVSSGCRTSYCRLGGLNHRNFCSHSSEAWKSKIKVSTHSFPGNISLPGFQMPPSPVLMWWREHTGLSSSSYKVLIPPWDSYFMTSSKPHYFPKALPPNITLEGKTSMHEFRRGYGLVLTCSHHPRLRTYLCLELSGIPANFL